MFYICSPGSGNDEQRKLPTTFDLPHRISALPFSPVQQQRRVRRNIRWLVSITSEALKGGGGDFSCAITCVVDQRWETPRSAQPISNSAFDPVSKTGHGLPLPFFYFLRQLRHRPIRSAACGSQQTVAFPALLAGRV